MFFFPRNFVKNFAKYFQEKLGSLVSTFHVLGAFPLILYVLKGISIIELQCIFFQISIGRSKNINLAAAKSPPFHWWNWRLIDFFYKWLIRNCIPYKNKLPRERFKICLCVRSEFWNCKELWLCVVQDVTAYATCRHSTEIASSISFSAMSPVVWVVWEFAAIRVQSLSQITV